MRLPESENLVIIPTYWAPSEPATDGGKVTYDHPTPLENSETLSRCLESLQIIEGVEFDVLVVAGASTPEIMEEMGKRICAIAEAVRPKLAGELFVFTADRIPFCKEALAKLPTDAEGFLKIDGYSNMRNAMLLLAAVLQAKVVVMVDDDEYVTDPDFLGKVLKNLGTRVGGKTVDGLAGYYVKPDGEWETEEVDAPWAAYWPKNRLINRTYHKLLKGYGLPDLVETPMAFGGCIAMTRYLYQHIPFDRRVPRGEDMDYLINARMFGYHFFMHRGWSVVHAPPPKSHPEWKRMRMDIVRFLNERQKLVQQAERPNMSRVELEDLMPYPGFFLGEDLMERFYGTSSLLAIEYLAKGCNREALECLENIAIAKRLQDSPRDGFLNLLELQKLWQGLHETIAASEKCRAEMIGKMVFC
jgi:hypothetical protein